MLEEAEQPEGAQPEDDDPEIDFGDFKIKKSEAKSGYMKDADYRRKTAEVAEAKRQTQALAEQVAAERVDRANRLDVFLESLQSELIGDQQALTELAATDPAEWGRQNQAFQVRAQRFNEALQQRQSLQQRIDADSERKQLDWRKEQRDLLSQKIPEWSDPAKASAEQKQIAEYALSLGYDAKELSELFDHRALLVLRDAARYAQAAAAKETAKAKQVTTPPNVQKPGAAKQPEVKTRTAYQEALAKARKTGRSEDIERALLLKGT